MTGPHEPRGLSRRTTLKWLAAAVMATPNYRQYRSARAQPIIYEPVSKGYGRDPDLNHPIVPWSRTMTARQLQLTAFLADLILPGTDSTPAPSALRIQDFVDEWISAPYPQQQVDRAAVLEGLRWLDAEAERRWQRGFLEVANSQQQQLLDETVAEYQTIPLEQAQQPELGAIFESVHEHFFSRFRSIVVGAYYTTQEGFRDIGYIGNVPLASYPPITEQEKTLLDTELRRLGILVR